MLDAVSVAAIRRALFRRLIFNLGATLGLFQALVWHWGSVVVGRGEGPGWAGGLALGAGLVVCNALFVPGLVRARRRRDGSGRAARLYLELGVATLLVGTAVALSWLLFVLLVGLLGAVGASPDLAFEVFRVGSLALVGGTALLTAWGYSVGQALVDRTHVRVAIPGLHPALAGLRIVQISDLHIGNGLEESRLDRMVERTNALDPDLIVVTGDIFDFDPSFVDDGARRLSKLRARYGVYAILGNHDTYVGADRVAEALARLAPGIRLLRDELVRVPVREPLYLAGLEDPGSGWSDRDLRFEGLDAVAAQRPDDGPTLLLAHRPEVIRHAAGLGFPLVITGHTHGGQLALPTPGGPYNLARVMTPFTRGLYRWRDTALYVNRGIGVGGPALRINCAREIATLELAPSEALLEHVDESVAPKAHLLVGAQRGAVGG